HPCPHESIIIPQKQFEGILTEVSVIFASLCGLQPEDRRDWIIERLGASYPADATNAEIIEDILTREMTDNGRFMLICPNCGRLHIQESAGEKQYRMYLPAKSVAILDVAEADR